MLRIVRQSVAGFGCAVGLVVGADAQELVYVSNVTGTSADGQPLLSIEGQTTRALDSLGEALRAHGLDYRDVVVANVFVRDSRHFAAMNGIYRKYFAVNPPTRATVEADLPNPDALIQISVVATPGDQEIIRPTGLQSPQLPYSWGIKTGNTLFIAGVTSRNPASYQPEGGSVGAQTSRVFGNIGLVLEAAGMAFGDLVSCKVFMEDARRFGAMNSVYRTFVSADDPPARATVQAGLMDPRFQTEIQCVAVQSGDRSVVVGEGMQRSSSPYSPGITAGDWVYTAGMVGRGPADAAGQTRIVLENVRRTLAAADLEFSNVVDTWVYLTDIREWPAVEAVLNDVLSADVPRGTVVGMPLMGPGLAVEIQMTARR